MMVYTVRLLNYKMRLEDMKYPIHLGVTEAGEGEEGALNRLWELAHCWQTALEIPFAYRSLKIR